MDDERRNEYLQLAHETLEAYLHERNLRVTPERVAMVDAVLDLPEHFTIEDLSNCLTECRFRVSLATLYNNMDMFVDAGILTRHTFGSVMQYERRLGMEPHLHRVCKVCGEVKNLTNDRWMRMVQQTTIRGFKCDFYQLYVYGTCSKCAAALRRKNKKTTKK